MDELLIPFGYNKITGAIVEPEDAERGRACNCICPGCRAPLLSRHPKVKRAHFAHDSKNKTQSPLENCPFSSDVAIAMMARHLVDSYVGKVLHTPEYKVMHHYVCCGQTDEVLVSNGATNSIDMAESNVALAGVRFDLKFVIGGYPLYIDLAYAQKQQLNVPREVLQTGNAGLLTLHCRSFSASEFAQNSQIRFSDAVLHFVLSGGFKEWVFHPREATYLHKAELNHQCGQHRKLDDLANKFSCLICGLVWEKSLLKPLECPKCGASHLYQRPHQDKC